LAESKRWFEKINLHPPQDASERIWDEVTQTILKL
ncbi:MAG: hypothetical protein ACI9AT_001293, partial [Ulvibacter sp.]